MTLRYDGSGDTLRLDYADDNLVDSAKNGELTSTEQISAEKQ